MPQRIAIFGATGDQGQAQVRRALAAGRRPIAIGRDLGKLEQLFGPHSELRAADYSDAASVARAIEGADAVFLTLPSTSFQAADSVICAAELVGSAARKAGVSALVFNASMIVKDTPRGFASHDSRWEMRRRLLDSGVPMVSIQPVIYQDNLLRAWARPAIAEGIVRYPHRPDLEVSWITQDDTADLMLCALDRPKLAGRSFNVGGAEAIRGPDLAQRLSRVLGRPFRFESQSIDDFTARMENVFRATASIEATRLIGELGRIYHWYNESHERPFFVDMTPVLAELPVQLSRFEDWAAKQTWPDPSTAEGAANG